MARDGDWDSDVRLRLGHMRILGSRDFMTQLRQRLRLADSIDVACIVQASVVYDKGSARQLVRLKQPSPSPDSE